VGAQKKRPHDVMVLAMATFEKRTRGGIREAWRHMSKTNTAQHLGIPPSFLKITTTKQESLTTLSLRLLSPLQYMNRDKDLQRPQSGVIHFGVALWRQADASRDVLPGAVRAACKMVMRRSAVHRSSI
jgi:hypothetical protein